LTIGVAWRSSRRPIPLSPSPAIASWPGVGNCVFHPADFALLNASVDQSRLGPAPSASMVLAARSAGRQPRCMYFLDSMFGWWERR